MDMRALAMLLVGASAAAAGLLIASCSVFGGENDPKSEDPAEGPDGAVADTAVSADASQPPSDALVAADADAKLPPLCACGAGTDCTDAGKCKVSQQPNCASRIVVAVPGSYQGSVCAGSSKVTNGVCSGEARITHVFLNNGPISQARVHADVGDIDSRTYTAASCGGDDGISCLTTFEGTNDTQSLATGESIAVGFSGTGCRDYTIDFF